MVLVTSHVIRGHLTADSRTCAKSESPTFSCYLSAVAVCYPRCLESRVPHRLSDCFTFSQFPLISGKMPPKRKSDAFEPLDPTVDQPEASSSSGDVSVPAEPATKKARVSDAGEGSSSGAKQGKKAAEPPKKWFEVVLDGEDEVSRSRNRSPFPHIALPAL